MDEMLQRQLSVCERRAASGDIHEMEMMIAHLRAVHGVNPALDEHLQTLVRAAYEQRLQENLKALRSAIEHEGFTIRMLAQGIRECSEKLGLNEPADLHDLERRGYRLAAERYVLQARREDSRQVRARLRSFARHFAVLAGPFCELEIEAALAAA